MPDLTSFGEIEAIEMYLTDQKKLGAEEGEEEPHALMRPRKSRRSSTPSGGKDGAETQASLAMPRT